MDGTIKVHPYAAVFAHVGQRGSNVEILSMTDVFISYSKADRAIAEDLADDLRSHGFDVWWDYELYAGDDFHDTIRDEIESARAVIVIWSEAAVASNWVRGEAQEASDFDTLISTVVPDFDTRWLPINFRTIHTEPIENLDRIIAAIERKRATAFASEADQGDADAQYELGARWSRCIFRG